MLRWMFTLRIMRELPNMLQLTIIRGIHTRAPALASANLQRKRHEAPHCTARVGSVLPSLRTPSIEAMLRVRHRDTVS